jgi:hypothetical protein
VSNAGSLRHERAWRTRMRGRWMALGRGTHTPAEHDEAEPEPPAIDTDATAARLDDRAGAPEPAGPAGLAGPTGLAGPEMVPPGALPPGLEMVPPEPRRHRRWVTAGLVALIIIVLVAAGAGVAALLTHGFHSKTTVKYRQAAIFSVRTGDCIDLTASGSTVHVVSCATSHDAEVFGTFQLSGAWPGDGAVRQQAAAGCESQLSGYINPQLATSGLTQSYVYPGETAWRSGQRTVVCEVRATSGQLTGSVRQG